MFILLKSRTSLQIGHVGSKTRSLGQILGKPCVRSRDQIFGSILMKLGQGFCHDEILYMFANGSCQVLKSLGKIIDPMLVTGGDLNPCSLILYHTIRKALVSDSRATTFYLLSSSPRHMRCSCFFYDTFLSISYLYHHLATLQFLSEDVLSLVQSKFLS